MGGSSLFIQSTNSEFRDEVLGARLEIGNELEDELFSQQSRLRNQNPTLFVRKRALEMRLLCGIPSTHPIAHNQGCVRPERSPESCDNPSRPG